MNTIPDQGKAPASVPDKERTGVSVTVTCTARLHLGFFDLAGGPGRRFGSIGLALDQPVTRLVARRADATRVSGPEAERVGRYLALMDQRFGWDWRHDIAVQATMPAHAGLGSGTQLALAVATAVRRLHAKADEPRADAALLERGARSGIGIGLFSQGGLVVDGGQGARDGPPPLLLRMAVPEAWRVLLVMDRGCEGLSGTRERAAFAALAPMPASVSGAICRLVLMQALPAVAEQDLAAFGSAITAIQGHVGDYFAPVQGGRFASSAVSAALHLLAEEGAAGIGQSSWGPTGFAFAADDDQARRLANTVEARLAAKRLDLLICRVLNRGASVEVA
ncbi:MAG TPA: beta-ribofuranosylaminobenzene 5'-phosphate synthase family protein [Rhodopila sp.]|nr:beta-ribofuranosylaminobenzene 5'-phosphate synthase family protein [Rhodopila sp.]